MTKLGAGKFGRRTAALFVGAFGSLIACGSEQAAEEAESPLDKDGGVKVDASVADGSSGVRIKEGRLEIEGKPTYLFGGEVQYFRVRDEKFDAAKTQALWKDSFKRMRSANMNLVTTYFPWDYHNLGEGKWDFSGARDVDAYLDAACSSGLKVVAKPGPLITGEWPRGFGSFGAVPDWWKTAHKETLITKADGSLFNFQAVPFAAESLQVTYLHPTYLKAVGDWFDHILPIIKKYIDKKCVVSVQIDNETNFYWSDRFGTVDYSPTAIAHYHDFLRARYSTIGALNVAYGTTYSSFDGVVAPSKLPEKLADNVPARDWYDAGYAYIDEYLGEVKKMIEARGIHEPDVLFTTNDSPFTVVGTVANDTRHLAVHDGRIKNKHGLAGLDAYPKHIPDVPGGSGQLANFPAQVEYFTKLYATFGVEYTKDDAHRFAYGAELQGGFYNFPLGLTAVVSPEATDNLLLKGVGHGLKGGAFYTLRGGINIDNSEYDFQAAISLDGEERPRFRVLRKWGAFLARFGEKLQWTEDVEDPIAVVQDITYAAPQGGTDDDHQLMYTNEYPGLFAWLIDAGFNPAVVDATTAKDLAKYKAAFYFAPKMMSDDATKLLLDLHKKGGMLVQFLDKGSFGLDGRMNTNVSRIASLFPVDNDGVYGWPRIPKTVGSGNLNDLGAGGDPLRGYWYEYFWKARSGGTAKVSPFLVERLAITGWNGKPIGLTFEGDGAPRALIGTYLSTVYNSIEYYSEADKAFVQRRAIARKLLAKVGITPTVYVDEVRAPVWARKKPGSVEDELYVFAANDVGARTLHLHLKSGASTGLIATRRYNVRDELAGVDYGAKTGAELEKSLSIPMEKNGVRVLVVTPI